MTNKDGFAHSRLLRARFIFIALALTLTLLIGWQSTLAAEPLKHFDLPSQDLSSALIEFAHQSGVQTLFGYDDSENEDIDALRTARVVGEFTAAEALTKMLEGTGLGFRIHAPGKIAVFRPTSRPPEQFAGPQPVAVATGSTAHPASIDEIYVTGTRVRGALDVVSPTLILPQRELRRTTFATVQDALYTLPINSLAGPREDWGDVAGNTGFGAGLNLRHLGMGATLVLVNGQRQPASGGEAAFTDVSSIPWSAVERIELVPDGSSALYGSDAIGGVVNIVMRERLDGAESQARLTTIDGADELQASQLFGKQWTSGHVLFAYQYSQRAPLDAAERAYAANMNKRPFGGSDHRTHFAGNIIDPATLQPVLGIPANGVRTAEDYLPGINLANDFEQLQLLPERQAHNVFFTATQAFGDRWLIRADGRYGIRDTIKRDFPASQFLVVPQSNPFFVDPFPDRLSPNAIVAHSFLQDLGPITLSSSTRVVTGTLSATAALAHDWRLVVSHAYGREALRVSFANFLNQTALVAALDQTDPARAFNPFGRTSPDVIADIRDTESMSSLSTINTTSVIADGTVGLMAAGPARLAIGTEYRKELFDSQRSAGSPIGPQSSIASQRYVGSVFAEAAVPVIGNPRDSHAAPRLELTAAGRFEHYSDFGHTFNPRMGVKWAPFDAVKLRGSWGKSFRAPTLVDRDTSRNLSGIVSLEDPKSPSGRSVIVGLQGNNPDVQEETATTWTAGLDFVPSTVPGLKFSLTYFDVDYGDRIVTPARNGPFEILLHEEQWGSVINRHPTPVQIDAICQRADFFGPGTCAEAQPSIIIDFRKVNLSQTEVRGLDADIGWRWDSGMGSWDFAWIGNYLIEFAQRDSAAAPAVDVLSIVSNPPALRARASAEWSQYPASGWAAAAAVHYTSGFRDNDSAFVTKVRPWTTVDLQLSYRTSRRDGWLAGLEVMLNAVNLLNTPPPFVDRPTGYDFVNAQPIGRTVSFEVRKNW